MKVATVAFRVLLFLGLAADVRGDRHRHHHVRVKHTESPVPPPGLTWAPAPGQEGAEPSPRAGAIVSAPSPAAPTFANMEGAMADLEMSFDIVNYNYYDLEKDSDDVNKEDAGDASDPESFLQTGETFGETVAETITKVFEKTIMEGLKNLSKTAPLVGSSMPLLGSSMPLIGNATRSTEVGAAFVAMAPAPAPAPPPMAAAAVAATEAAIVDPEEEQVNVFVTFRPGPAHKPVKESFLQVSSETRTTVVDVVITDKPMTGANILDEVRNIVQKAQVSGMLRRRLKAALFQATGISPSIKGLSEPPVTAELKQWEEGSCEKHMKKLVKLMEVAYTRRMVPLALYNECTNLIPSLSFSHDDVASALDRKKCRMATVKFAKRWNYGKADWNYGAGKGHEPMDFSGFCRDVCETRFGAEAPQCGVDKQVATGV
mmetsp:Transcript_31350/g.90012  ORF Transcript_31350/g.90012 Transcript_31350/m.90012 type:complete len:430 (-) Transcript_31350:121-1410(-)